MTTTTYLLHPAPGTTEQRNSYIVASPDQTSNEAENTGPNGGLPSNFGRDLGGAYANGFFRFDLGATLTAPIARSIIQDARLRLRAFSTDSTALSCGVCLLARDGVWNAPTGTLGYGLTATRSCSLQLFTLAGGLGTQIVTTGAAAAFEQGIKGGTPSPELFRNTVGQSVLITGGTVNCGSAKIALNRVGTPDGMVSVEIYACVANDGSNNRPTGSPIATSTTVVPTILTTAGTGVLVTFDFASPPSLVSGNRYVALVQWSGTASATAYIAVSNRTTAPYANGSTIVGTHCYAFHRNAWVRPRQLPHLFNTPVNGNIWAAPYGGAANYDTVAIPVITAGVYYEIDITRLVQMWVNDPAYIGDFLGVHLAPVFGTPLGNARDFDAAELVVTHRLKPVLHSSRLGWVM